MLGRTHEKVGWNGLLEERISNNDDGKVVMDCVILSCFIGKLVLVTKDKKHILSEKDVTLNFINDYCSVVQDLPER